MTTNPRGWFRGKPPLIQRIQADRTAMRALARKKRNPTPWTVVRADYAGSLMASYEYLEDAEQAVRYLTNNGVPCNIIGPYREGALTSREDSYAPTDVEWHVVTRTLERDERYAFSSFADAMAYAERQTRKAVIQEWHDGMLFSIEQVYRPNGNTRKVLFPTRNTNQQAVEPLLSPDGRVVLPRRIGSGLTELTTSASPSNKHVSASQRTNTATRREAPKMWDEEVDDSIDYDRGMGVATKPLKPPNLSQPSPQEVWDNACFRFAALSEKLTAFETDPESVYFTRPLLRDVTEPATARFYDVYGAAQVLVHDHFDPSSDDVDELFRAVTKAERAWDAADDNARRKAHQGVSIGGHNLTDNEMKSLNTAKRALVRVLDPASSPAEAAKAWNLVQSIVDELRLRPSENLEMKVVLALPSALRELERA